MNTETISTNERKAKQILSKMSDKALFQIRELFEESFTDVNIQILFWIQQEIDRRDADLINCRGTDGRLSSYSLGDW